MCAHQEGTTSKRNERTRENEADAKLHGNEVINRESNGVIRKQSNRVRMVVAKTNRPKDSKMQKIGVKQPLTMPK